MGEKNAPSDKKVDVQGMVRVVEQSGIYQLLGMEVLEARA